VGQPAAFDGRALQISTPDAQTLTLPLDALIACLGISPRLGPIADWGLNLVRKQVPVDTERFQTREAGVFAVGDINTYPGKKKLIVCGFHEATLAAWGATAIVFPGKAVPLQYTTTSTRLHQLLGVG
jgi:thioredoxin reductase (NADPH)